MLREMQQNFRVALLGDDDGALPALMAGDPGRARRRIAIYRNNVRAGLTEVLARTFPVTRRIVGGEFFVGVAQAFVSTAPPTAPQLSIYGSRFPTFLESFDRGRRLPYLPDVARLEWAWTEAYFAADASSLDLGVIVAASDTISEQRLVPHPATRWLHSAFPIVTIWEINRPDVVDVPAVDLSQSEGALVTRASGEVRVRRIGRGNTALLAALGAGVSLGDAVAAALTAEPDLDLENALADHFAAGSFSRLEAVP